jgi:hypothetical protein
MPQLCTSPTPLPREPLTSNKNNPATAVPPPLPRRPRSKNIINNSNNNNHQNTLTSCSPNLRASLPVPLCRSPFNSPVRANSLPHAPKVPPRERKPKEIQVFQKPKVVFLNNHAVRNHLNPNNNNHNHRRHLPNSSKQYDKSKNTSLSPKSSIEKHNKTTTTNLSEEMIQMISEREREMFDYHATSRKQQPHNIQKPTNQNHNNTCKNEHNKQQQHNNNSSSITTMEQIYCQKCHLLLPKNHNNNSKSRSSSNSSSLFSSSNSRSTLSCCFWLISIKNYISKKWNGRRSTTTVQTSKNHNTRKYDKCKEFDSASVDDEITTTYCSCDKQLK